MKKYFLLIGMLLILIFAGIAYSVALLFPNVNSRALGVRRDITIAFDKNTQSFTPRVLTVTEGDTVYLKLINDDTHEHGLAIDAYGITMRAPAQNTILLSPFTATKAGHFIFYCPVLDESSLSETGTLIVRPFKK